jgi:hypothetical protein
MRSWTTALALALAFLGSSPATAATDDVAGMVLRVKGTAIAVRDAEPRLLNTGATIHIGDVLSTGKDSRLEIKMIDDGVFTLGERTSFVVLDYTFGTAGGGAGTGAIRLLTGAINVATGRLAQVAERPLTVEGELATIGIRGTKAWIGTMPNGEFHVGLWEGKSVTVENQAGRVEITQPGFGTHLTAKDRPPTHPHPWPESMSEMARQMTRF